MRILSRQRRTSRPLRLEALEERRLLAIDMSPDEQLILEYINRARANPTAEAARYGIDLSDGFPPGSILPDPRQPLAPHSALNSSARGHSQSMIDLSFFAHHNPFTGTDPSDRAIAAGYGAGAGENIAKVTGGASAAHAALFRSPGHRVNLLGNGYRDAGIGAIENRESFFTYTYVTENFGFGTASAITGVAFNDHLSGDNFYNIGEGLIGVTISAQSTGGGAPLATTTGTSGGYTIPAPPGTYIVTASGGGLPAPLQRTVTIGNENVKIDFVIPDNPPPADAFEPNDSFAQATAIPLDSQGGGFVCGATIHTNNNADYYRFTVNSAGTTWLNLYDEGVDGPLAFDIYDDARRWLASSEGFHVLESVAPGTSFYARVSGARHGDYDLEINNDDNNDYGHDDAYEPNQDLATATALPAGDHVVSGASIRNYGDQDLYTWMAPASGVVKLRLQGGAPGRWQLAVNVEGGAGPMAIIDTKDGVGTYEWNAVAGVKYVLAVSGRGCLAFDLPYDITVDFRDPPLAKPEALYVHAGQARTIDVLANDTADAAWPAGAVNIVQPPVHGSVSIHPTTGVVTYTPAASFLGFDSFRYTARDIYGVVSNIASVNLAVVDAAIPWRNPVLRFDIDADGAVAPLDALLVINQLNASGPLLLSPPPSGPATLLFMDVSGDNQLSPLDALLVINYLNADTDSEGEAAAPVSSHWELEAGWWAALFLAWNDEAEDDREYS